MLGALAVLVFLGALGSMELWGKREQRAVAESIDTVDRGHWLVAEIQGRPRLEKPPLPRWALAVLMTVTGSRAEWVMRLPSALAGLGLVWLTYALGRRMAGRSVGLAAGFALVSMVFAIVEMRQAGNDAPLAFFVALAIYAAWRRLHEDEVAGEPGERPGHAVWGLVVGLAMGLGFLTKGPIVVPLVGLSVAPYLAVRRRLGVGLRLLLNRWGVLVFVGLAVSWPVLVMWSDANAWDVWMLEMGQKTAAVGVAYHHKRDVLAVDWPSMAAPWSLFAVVAVVGPLGRRRAEWPGSVWLAWFWALGNLGMFCLWSTAKPNYYLPCVSAVALLSGWGWVRVVRRARESVHARRMLLGHWVVLLVVGAVVPVVVMARWPGFSEAGWLVSGLVVSGVVASVWVWRRGGDAEALAPMSAMVVGLALVIYGQVTPDLNGANGYRTVAERVQAVVPAEARTVRFFRELDEAMWYYLPDRELRPIASGQIRYNTGFDMLEAERRGVLIHDDWGRVRDLGERLARWMEEPRDRAEYVLMRTKDYELYAPQVAGLAEVKGLGGGLEVDAKEAERLGDFVVLKVGPRAEVAREDAEGLRR